MFDNPINIIVAIILVAGWALVVYLVISLVKPRKPKLPEVQPPQTQPTQAQLPPISQSFTPAPTEAAKPTILDVMPGSKAPIPAPVQTPVSATPHNSSEGVLLSIEVPKENETTPLAAELMFASLHGIYKQELSKGHKVQDAISFEMQAQEKSIRFFVWVPRYLQGYVEGQIYAQYQGVNIQEVKDYAHPSKISPESAVAAAELVLNREDIFPIKSFDSFEVDPLAAITSTLSKLADPAQIWVQIVVRPENDKWRDRALDYIDAVKTGRTDFGTALVKGFKSFASDVISSALSGKPPSENAKADSGHGAVQLAPGVEDALKQIEEKSKKLGFQTKIRIVALDRTWEEARQRLDLVVGSFKQFNTTNLNGFVAAPVTGSRDQVVELFSSREFTGAGAVLNVTELASIYHLPSKTVSTPHIVWSGSKKGEPPANLPLADELDPQELTNMGVTNFRGSEEIFGIRIPDRRRHIYVIGKSGVGKSTLLQNMTLDDIKEGRGVGVVDPHGDYIDYVLERIPDDRVEDVILFDPSDQDHPVGFNILDVANPKYKVIAASGVVSVFKKIFGDSWGPRLEYWLSSAVLALLDYEGATLMMLPRLFTDDAFRNDVVEKIADPVIKARWVNEYNTLDQRQRAETISPILNKVGQFLSSSLVRNIVAQSKGSFDLRKVMDERKILLVKLAKGLIGEDNAALLGAMIVTQLQLAAMSRADEVDQEKRSDFFLYVDEFQNFATDSFAVILSEARKYRLSLTLAHQFIAQLPETVANAVIGNVGTIIAFRVGANDAPFLVKEFSPVFDEQDLMNLNVFNIYLKLSVDGLTADAFSAITLPPSADVTGNLSKVIDYSRKQYARELKDVKMQVDTQTAALTSQPPAGYGRPAQRGGYPGGGGGGNRPPQQQQRPAQQPQQQAPASSPQAPQVPSPAPSQNNMPPQSSRPSMANPRGNAPFVKKSPNVDALKTLLAGIQKKTPAPLAPEEQANLAKTLMDDLKGTGGNSFKDALNKAQDAQKAESQTTISGELKPNQVVDIDPEIKEFLDDQTGK